MRPYCENNCSNSFWVIVFGRPLTYKFASLIDAELGRAYDTYGWKKRRGVLVSESHPPRFKQTDYFLSQAITPELRRYLFRKTNKARKNKGRARETLKTSTRVL